MDFTPTAAETEMAMQIKKITGKKLRTCHFCVRYHRGNFGKALELCSGEPKEGDRHGEL